MKLAITHTKKVPGQEEYSSEGFGATIEVEIPDETARDTETLRSYLAELYAEAKQAVEEQIKTVPRRNGDSQPAAQASSLFGRPNGNQPEQRSRAGNGQGVATPKQVSSLISLGARNKLTYADLVQVAQERFKAEDLYQLSKQDASQMIDELKLESSPR